MPDDDKPSKGVNRYDNKKSDEPLIPRNIKKKPSRQTAVAVGHDRENKTSPKITAAGREKIAEQIMNLAFEHGVRVREDTALAEMLAALELDSPIPEDAFIAVAEILSMVYKANGQEDPFDAILTSSSGDAENDDDGTDGKDKKPDN